MAKVRFMDKRLLEKFSKFISAIATALTLILIFVEIPQQCKIYAGALFICSLFIIYTYIWYKSENLECVNLEIEGSSVVVKSGDIFEQPGLKAIAFNEYFDTKVDNIIISENSLNGIFIKKFFPNDTTIIDSHIENYRFDPDEVLEINNEREDGKLQKYRIGTICVYNDFLLAAFTKFDSHNRAWLTMPEYLDFLITFWDRVNRIYAQQSVSVPVFGSGITRIKEHRNIGDEDLLKIMLWTFRISETRFKYPAKLTIVIHKEKIKKINLLDILSARNGL